LSIRSAVRSFITLAVLSSLSSVALAQLVSPASAPDSSRQIPSERAAQSNTKDEPEPTPKSSAPAQEQTNPPSTVPGASSTQGKVQGTSNDRLFYALPNFLSLENAGQVSPLTTKQKFSVVARSSFDYVVYPWYGFLAGISQAENSEPGFGQGFGGYGKRFASALADGTIENFMTGAVLPSLLHQDPRFFSRGREVLRTGQGMRLVELLSPVRIRAMRSSTIPRSWVAPCRPHSLPIPIIPGVPSLPQSLDPDFTGQIEP
jgi:hypothetical protein